LMPPGEISLPRNTLVVGLRRVRRKYL
jgi:hypothetical protein